MSISVPTCTLASGPLAATSSSAFTIWLKEFRGQVQKYGIPGDAIYRGVRYMLPVPDPFGALIINGAVSAYSAHDFTPDAYDLNAPFALTTPRALTSKGLSTFRAAVVRYDADKKSLSDLHGVLSAFMLAQLSNDVLSSLQVDAAFTTAVTDADTFTMFSIIVTKYSGGTFSGRLTAMQSYTSAKQGDKSHPTYMEYLRNAESTALSNFPCVCPSCNLTCVCPGCNVAVPSIPVADLTFSIYLQGIDPDKFKFKIEEVLSNYSSIGPLTTIKCWNTIQLFDQYNTDKNHSLDTSSSSYVSALSASEMVLAAPASTGSGKKCISCQCVLTWSYSRCGPCWRQFSTSNPSHPEVIASKARFASQRSKADANGTKLSGVSSNSRPGPIVKKPSAAELQAARAMIAMDEADALSDLDKARLLVAKADANAVHDRFGGYWAGAFTSSLSEFFLDNACSFTMVASLDMLESATLLANPRVIGGIAQSSIKATHVGVLRGWPSPFNVAYFCPNIGINLYSLGAFEQAGGTYIGSNGTLTLYDDHKQVIFTASRNSDSNICTVPLSLAGSHHGCAGVLSSHKVWSNEEYIAMDLAELLHISYAHFDDAALILALDTGMIPNPDGITSQAIRNNRLVCGPCPHCLAGKIKRKSMVTSKSPPVSTVGEVISTDVSKLEVPTPNGNTHRSIVVDKRSGKIDIIFHKSKTTHHVTTGLLDLFRKEYNAYGYKITRLESDGENVYTSTTSTLGAHGIQTGLSPPDNHATVAERYTQTLDNAVISIRSGLAFDLPRAADPYVMVFAANKWNKLPNTASSPHSPHVLIQGLRHRHHEKHPNLPFGAVCMVQKFPQKSRADADRVHTSVKGAPKSEMGVCMGIDPDFPTSYLFMLENKSVVPRNVFTPVPNCTPFDWPRKYSPRAMLPPRVVPFVSTHIQNGDVSSNYLDDPTVVIPSTTSTLQFNTPTPRPVIPITSVPISDTVSTNSDVSIPTSATSLDVVHTITTVPSDILPSLPTAVHVTQDIPVSAELAPVLSDVNTFIPRRSLRIKVATVPGQYGSHVAVADKSMHPDNLSLAVLSGIVANPDDWSMVYSKKALARQSALKAAYMESAVLAAPASVVAPISADEDEHTYNTRCPDEFSISEAHAVLNLRSSMEDKSMACSAVHNLRPQPSSKCKEHSLKDALRSSFSATTNQVTDAIQTHMDKLINELGTMSLIADADIKPDAVFLYSHILLKIKSDGRMAARLAAGGNR